VIVALLSEDPKRKVRCSKLTRSAADSGNRVDAEKSNQLLLQSPYIVMYPTRRIDGSEFYLLAGRISGGGSSVNMMAIPRPIKADLDSWAAEGNPEWTWDRVLPVLIRMESDQDFPNSPIHGNSGPVYVKRKHLFDAPISAQEQAMLEALTKLGIPRFEDQNIPNPHGVAPRASNIKNGRRQSAAVVYLAPARERANLTIIDEAQVMSVILNGNKAQELRYRKAVRNARSWQTRSCSAPGLSFAANPHARASARVRNSSAIAYLSSMRSKASAKTTRTIRWSPSPQTRKTTTPNFNCAGARL
jgi:choline dehydrogenase-like flavoprotein